MLKHHLPFLIACICGLLPIAARAAEAPAKPNILFIMTDDHAVQALSCYGSNRNKTPNMDRIAKEGVRFDRFFVTNSICTPSRAVMLTGKYSHLNGVPVFNSIDPASPNVAKYLQKAGYHTGVIGKWHLGTDPTGFDDWIVLPGQGAYYDPQFLTPTGPRQIKGYVTEITTDLTIAFLEKRPRDKPFFLMSHQKAPHRAWEPSQKYKEEFSKKTFAEPETLYDDYKTRTDAIKENRQRVFDDLTRRDLKLKPPEGLKGPELAQWMNVKPKEVEIEIDGTKKTLSGDELNKWKYQRYMQDYFACVQSVDDSVGQILDYLDKNDLAKNTIVVYTSDQGFYLGEKGMYDKRFMYEESFRTPLLVRWPGVAKAGTVQSAIAGNIDFAPTFLSAASTAVPDDMQGHSLIPLLKGEVPKDWRTSFYYRYYHDPGDHNTARHYGVRTVDHKLIYFWKKDQWEMYDLNKDPNELNNVYNDPAYATTQAALKEELYRLKKELKDDDQFADELPQENRRPATQPGTTRPARPNAKNKQPGK
ncbi:sulfatase family protein [Humisphaera borealis]|uniref:Sulfatase n=1 Tax=Humisphaera borealis TaxID=2807512 RepID=A0A7M2WSW7_9BACT|nr:sulfatase [Humisphaera borealis]QOV88597.1 sulfatase [Humisphaera borealis]